MIINTKDGQLTANAYRSRLEIQVSDRIAVRFNMFASSYCLGVVTDVLNPYGHGIDGRSVRFKLDDGQTGSADFNEILKVES